MGSSCPAFWDERSSRRKEISRLFERKRKTIAFYKLWSFLFNWCEFKIRMTSTMSNQRNSQILLAILILCICLGGFVLKPFTQVNLFVSVISDFAVEDQNLLTHVELDDDYIALSVVSVIIVGVNFSKSRPMKLDFQSACLTPVFPPPKY